MTIQPTAVYPPGNSPASQQQFYQTYNTRNVGGGGGYTPPPSGGGTYVPGSGGGGFLYRQFQRAPGGSAPVSVPSGVPKFLGSRSIILYMWIAAMMMVSLDEWHTHGVLPRPARLWYTSLTYFILALISAIDAVTPLASMLAIGYTIAVAYNYYNGSGGFGNYGAQEAAGQTPTSAGGTTSGLGGTGTSTSTSGGGGGAPKAA